MLSNELQGSTNPRDIERYDTLCDVNMSCIAAVDILNDLLCYEKLDSGILILHKEDVVIMPFLKECVSMFAAQARECGVTMSILTDTNTDNIAISADMITSLSLHTDDSIFVDKFKMDQVIRNLISNALKFTPRGGTMTVTAAFVPRRNCEDNLTLRYPSKARNFLYSHSSSPKIHSGLDTISQLINGHLIVVVTDSGAGISAENQKRLFKDIVQFNPEKLQAGGGSGLGLWISSGIVDLHDGKISVYSDGEGTGCSFTVEIPMLRSLQGSQCDHNIKIGGEIYRADDVDLIAESKSGCESVLRLPYTSLSDSVSYLSLLSPASGGISFDVLVVDDSHLNRKMLLKYLKKDGHRCTEAEDGLQAIERVKEKIDYSNGGHGLPYHAILMDFIMPNMDGPTAVKEIRSMGYTAPIFGVTGNGKLQKLPDFSVVQHHIVLSSAPAYYLSIGSNESCMMILLETEPIIDFFTAMIPIFILYRATLRY